MGDPNRVEFKVYDPQKPHVITSFKGNQKLIFEGYRYNIHHIVTNRNLKTWRCVCAKKLTTHRSWCKGRAETGENDTRAVSKGDHNHDAEHDTAELEFFKSQLILAAVNYPHIQLNDLIEQAQEYMTPGAQFSSRESLKKSLTVARKSAENGEFRIRQYKSAEYKNGKPKPTKRELKNEWEDGTMCSLLSLTKGYGNDEIIEPSGAMPFDEADDAKQKSPGSPKSDLSATRSTCSQSSLLHEENLIDGSLDFQSPPSKMPKYNNYNPSGFDIAALNSMNLLMPQIPTTNSTQLSVFLNALSTLNILNPQALSTVTPAGSHRLPSSVVGVPPSTASTPTSQTAAEPVRTSTPSATSASDEKKGTRITKVLNRLTENAKNAADAERAEIGPLSMESSSSTGASTAISSPEHPSNSRKRTRSMSTQTEQEDSREGSPLDSESARLSKCLGGGCSCRVIQVCCCRNECKRRRKSLSPKRSSSSIGLSEQKSSSVEREDDEVHSEVVSSDTESVQASED